ncbi:hypothetical protein K437DRAFT_267162 [Tilletiaria anomala UBC 951]|uniref:Sld7 C-terminal domain-containing protein n=1 Tax=Tilletiaria anomala (strain ATCC 24038 / CBS 436.72 / UBC 951) TaxID=1037660 RepID=A0A066WK18_TILAU|nr:uncharacterized protein K437DRAFT_267162 [Tilletiaria anomala UBC 951]KDN51344.1 hypothetical protein K437DRAFT_267162 [Tilletiaria anomala UBC 951]
MTVAGFASPPPPGNSGVSLVSTPSRPPPPRLLWRGSLLLPDGTALPGVAFVSHSHPLSSGAVTLESEGRPFSNTREVQRPGFVDEDDDLSTKVIDDPAIEADLCLALEMVRHRPLRILGTEKDTRGMVVEGNYSKSKPTGYGGDTKNIVKWEYSIGMRMYIDPEEERTLDYFSGASSSSSAQELAIFAASRCSSHVHALDLVLGRKVVRKARTRKHGADTGFGSDMTCALPRHPFSPRPDDPMPRTNAFITKLQTRPRQPMSRVASKSVGNFAVPHVPALSSSDFACSGSLKTSTSSSDVNRTPSLSDGGGVNPAFSSASGMRARSTIARKTVSSGSAIAAGLSTSGKQGNTPGRRGEKRPPRKDPLRPSSYSSSLPGAGETSPSASPSRKRHADTIQLAIPVAKRSSSRAASATPGPDSPVLGAASSIELLREGMSHCHYREVCVDMDAGSAGTMPVTSAYNTMEQKNRTTIKKLVHHQLLGRGYEKNDADYIACYGATCSGTAVALRHALASVPVDRVRAATLVRMHLDLYLAPTPVESAASGTAKAETSFKTEYETTPRVKLESRP